MKRFERLGKLLSKVFCAAKEKRSSEEPPTTTSTTTTPPPTTPAYSLKGFLTMVELICIFSNIRFRPHGCICNFKHPKNDSNII